MKATLCIAPCCNQLAVQGHNYCDKHLQESQEKRKAFANAVRRNDSLYRTPEWRKLRKEVLKQCPFCIICGNKSNLTVDHIIPAEGNELLFFEPSNLQVLCNDCHRIKTAQEIMERKKDH